MVSGISYSGVSLLTQLFSSSSAAANGVLSGTSALPGADAPAATPTILPSQVVVATAHDRIDRVLDKFGVPYQKVDRRRLTDPLLAGARYLFVGCGQPLPEGAPERIAAWVEAGGCLMSTDWMVYHLLEKAFRDEGGRPIVRYRRPLSAEETAFVSVTQADWHHPATTILLGADHPLFWKISKCAYPVHVEDAERVQVLARSAGLFPAVDGANALFLRFSYGSGEIVHLVSHWSDQHFEEPLPSDRRPPSHSMIFDRH